MMRKRGRVWYNVVENCLSLIHIWIAENVLAFQRCTGGWPKNIDMARRMNDKELAKVIKDKSCLLYTSTHYPWNGDVTIGVNKNNAGPFTLKIRIPGWVRNQVVPSDLYTYADGKRLSYTVKVNGEPVQSELKDGYFCIDRRWKKMCIRDRLYSLFSGRRTESRD